MKFKSRIKSLWLGNNVYRLLVLSFLFSLTFWINILPANAHSPLSVWEAMREDFMLNHEVTRPEVQTQLRWLIAHPSYLEKLAQSEPYIYHIVTELKKRKLPGEIALIPMIESSYDPFAYSGAGAAGLWQLMPGTGTDLGLKRDWWFDARRSIAPSTNAALNYLSYLHNFFNGDWILAVAAYDLGEGALARIIKNSGQAGRRVNFWSLNVPEETRAYVPRLLALAEIIQNPQRYRIRLPDIPHAPYFEEVNIGSQIDLNNAAKLAGISYKDLIKLNPGFNRWATAPYRPYKLLIPADKAEDFMRKLALIPEDERVSLTRHRVSAGDNLILIAQKYHTTVNLIRELNQLKSNAVHKGQYVLIPKTKNAAPTLKITKLSPNKAGHFFGAKQIKIIHIVQVNETYAQLQKKYRVSANEITTWNHLNIQKPLQKGQQLIIWKHVTQSDVYIVKFGDNLSTIARKNNIPMSTLLKLNPGITQRPLQPKQRIRLG